MRAFLKNGQNADKSFSHFISSAVIGENSWCCLRCYRCCCQAEPHSSVGSVANLIIGGHLFDPLLGQYSFQRMMIVIVTGFIPFTAVHCFHNGYVGKQPVAWKECCADYWLKELQESMDRCTGRHDITEIL